MRRLHLLILLVFSAAAAIPHALRAQRAVITASATVVEGTSIAPVPATVRALRGGRSLEVSAPVLIRGGSRYTLAIRAADARGGSLPGVISVRDERGVLRRVGAEAAAPVSGTRGVAAGEAREIRFEVDAARASAAGEPASVVYVIAANS